MRKKSAALALDNTSTTCSAIGCTTPLPDQRDLGGTGENDCQKDARKAALNYLLKREHFIEQCMLKGGTRGSCLARPDGRQMQTRRRPRRRRRR